MKLLPILLVITLAAPLQAKPKAPSVPKATPAPALPLPTTPVAPEGYKLITIQHDLELRDWIEGAMKASDGWKAQAEAADAAVIAAQADTAKAQEQAGVAVAKDAEAEQRSAVLQTAIDAQAEKLATAIDQRNHAIADAAAYKKESDKRGNVIGWLGAAALALLASHLIAFVPDAYKPWAVFALPALGGIIGYFLARILI